MPASGDNATRGTQRWLQIHEGSRRLSWRASIKCSDATAVVLATTGRISAPARTCRASASKKPFAGYYGRSAPAADARIPGHAGASRKKSPEIVRAHVPCVCGGADEDRTHDLCIANAALSHLSYRPTALMIIRNRPMQGAGDANADSRYGERITPTLTAIAGRPARRMPIACKVHCLLVCAVFQKVLAR